jgi:hypothetical protein
VRIWDDQGDGGFVDLHHRSQPSMTFPVGRYKAPLDKA